MPIYPRGTSFMVSIGSGLKRLRETCGTLEEAQAKEQELIASRSAATLRGLEAAHRGDSSKTLQDAFERTYRETWAGSKGERTTVLNAKAMVKLLGSDTPITAIVSDVIDEALDELDDKGNTGATINKKIATLNVMLKTAEDKGWVKFVPRIKRRKEASQRIHWYTEAQEREMLDACFSLGLVELSEFIVFQIDTGFRRSETLAFKLADYQDGYLRLHNGETKNDQGRTIPATEPVKAIIKKYQGGSRLRLFEGLTENILRGYWAQMRHHLGKNEDSKYIVHVLRHTTATRLALAGATSPEIMSYMGHKAIQTSMRYVHLNSKHLTRATAMLTRTPPPPPELKLVEAA